MNIFFSSQLLLQLDTTLLIAVNYLNDTFYTFSINIEKGLDLKKELFLFQVWQKWDFLQLSSFNNVLWTSFHITHIQLSHSFDRLHNNLVNRCIIAYLNISNCLVLKSCCKKKYLYLHHCCLNKNFHVRDSQK